MSENSTVGLVFVLVVGVAFVIGIAFVVGISFVVGGFLWVEDARAVNTYEETQATVVSAEIREGSDVGELYVEVEYEHAVENREYRRSDVYTGTGQVSKSGSKQGASWPTIRPARR